MNETINPKTNKPYTQEELSQAYANNQTLEVEVGLFDDGSPILLDLMPSKTYLEDGSIIFSF